MTKANGFKDKKVAPISVNSEGYPLAYEILINGAEILSFTQSSE